VGYVAENFTHLGLFPANLEDKGKDLFPTNLGDIGGEHGERIHRLISYNGLMLHEK